MNTHKHQLTEKTYILRNVQDYSLDDPDGAVAGEKPVQLTTDIADQLNLARATNNSPLRLVVYTPPCNN